MNKPEYTKDPVYQKLVAFCKACGLSVGYGAPDDRWRARTDRNCIQVQPDSEYKNTEEAALVLGHELAHTVSDSCGIPANVLADYGFTLYAGDEKDLCDIWGTAFCQLASMIVSTSIERKSLAAFEAARAGPVTWI